MNSNPHKSLGKWMTVGAWIIALVFLTLFFDKELEQMRNPNQHIDSMIIEGEVREIVLQRNRGGHYLATGRINGEKVEFLLDTGASDVAIPQGLARRLGLKPGPVIHYRTANGVVQGNRTEIAKVELGDIILNNVTGGINPGMHGEQVLLGMSFLKHIEFIQRGNTLTIRQRIND